MKCQNDLIYLSSQVLGSDDPKKNVWGKIHTRIADSLKNLNEECLILIPRGHFKSTLVTQNWTIQQFLKDPTLRVLIASAELKHAEKFVAAIENQLSKNKKFIERFGSFRAPDCMKWSPKACDIVGKSHGDKENSVTSASTGTDCTSQHYDIIILDDMVNRRFASSDEMREKTWKFYMDCLDLLEPDGKLIFIGTRWHFEDMYNLLLDEYKTDKTRFDFVVNEAILLNDKYNRREFKKMLNDKDTKTLFPEKFGIKEVARLYKRKMKKAGGVYEFSCQQMNSPAQDEEAPFKWEDIEFVKSLPCTATLYQNVDPAGTQKIGGDDAAICTTAIDINGDVYNVDMFCERVTADRMFQKMQDYYMKYPSVKKIGLEESASTNHHLYIREKYPEIRKKLKSYRAAPDRKKTDRMLALQPYVSNGKFKIVEHDDGKEYVIGEKRVKLYPGQHKLIQQMLDFGATGHDDALDAQASVLQFMKKKKAQMPVVDAYEYKPNNSKTGY